MKDNKYSKQNAIYHHSDENDNYTHEGNYEHSHHTHNYDIENKIEERKKDRYAIIFMVIFLSSIIGTFVMIALAL